MVPVSRGVVLMSTVFVARPADHIHSEVSPL
jgi:hypothetical protein